MKAAVYHGTRDIRIEQRPDPAPATDEVVLEVHATGICGTDASEYQDGPFQYPITAPHPVTGHSGPMVPGHEVAGRVVAVGGAVRSLRAGDVVASGGGISCGSCSQCVAGRTNLCIRYATVGLQRDGGLAQFCAVPESTCVRIEPYGIREDTAGLAQPMAIAVHSMRQATPTPGERALVIGAGGIGAFLTYALAQLGVHVLVADMQESRLRNAADLGAADTIRVTPDADLADAVLSLGPRPAIVYEVTGSAPGWTTALTVLERGGRFVAVGLHNTPRQLDVRRFTLDELHLFGTMAHACGADLPEALRLLSIRTGGWTDVAAVVIGLDRLVPDGILPLVEGRSSQIKTLVDPWVSTSRPASHR